MQISGPSDSMFLTAGFNTTVGGSMGVVPETRDRRLIGQINSELLNFLMT